MEGSSHTDAGPGCAPDRTPGRHARADDHRAAPQGPDRFSAHPRLAVADLVLPDERRREPRTPARGATVCSFSGNAGGSRLTSVLVRDTSTAGLGLHSPVPVEPGATVALYPLSRPVATDTGRVVRCEPHPEGGWCLGVRRQTGSSAVAC